MRPRALVSFWFDTAAQEARGPLAPWSLVGLNPTFTVDSALARRVDTSLEHPETTPNHRTLTHNRTGVAPRHSFSCPELAHLREETRLLVSLSIAYTLGTRSCFARFALTSLQLQIQPEGRDPGYCRRQSLVGCSGSGSEDHRFRCWFDKPVGWLTHSGVAFPLVASLPTVLKATVGIGVAHAV